MPATRCAASTTSNGATKNPMTSGISVNEMVHEMPLRTSTLMPSCSASRNATASTGPIHSSSLSQWNGCHEPTANAATSPRLSTAKV